MPEVGWTKMSNLEYTDSAEFTEELYTVAKKIKEIRDIVGSERWAAWMKVTDENFMTQTMGIDTQLQELVNLTFDKLDELDNEMTTV